jgi:uncharacterized membrane protein (DUF4010 family)
LALLGADTELGIARNLAVAALAGLAVGIERERSGIASGPHARFAGVRTFFLLGLCGGLSGWLLTAVAVAAGVVLVATAGALVVAAYVMAARRSVPAIDGTTEVAAITVLGLGMLAGVGQVAVASGAAAVVVMALGEKQAIQKFVARIGDQEMRAALKFAVLALVVLPLLPEGPYGPFDAIRPRSLWSVVLLFSGLNFLGYLVRRAAGPARGYSVAGALGGLMSSTAVTLTFARQSRREPQQSAGLALGAVAASVVLVPRVLLLVTALDEQLAIRAAVALSPMFVIGVILVAGFWVGLRNDSDAAALPTDTNPLHLAAAIRMAVAFQLVLIGVELVSARFGTLGVYAGAALVGLTDVDALTVAMSRLARDRAMEATAALALLIGILANTTLKAALALVLGSPSFRWRVGAALAALAALGMVGWWLVGVVFG